MRFTSFIALATLGSTVVQCAPLPQSNSDSGSLSSKSQPILADTQANGSTVGSTDASKSTKSSKSRVPKTTKSKPSNQATTESSNGSETILGMTPLELEIGIPSIVVAGGAAAWGVNKYSNWKEAKEASKRLATHERTLLETNDPANALDNIVVPQVGELRQDSPSPPNPNDDQPGMDLIDEEKEGIVDIRRPRLAYGHAAPDAAVPERLAAAPKGHDSALAPHEAPQALESAEAKAQEAESVDQAAAEVKRLRAEKLRATIDRLRHDRAIFHHDRWGNADSEEWSEFTLSPDEGQPPIEEAVSSVEGSRNPSFANSAPPEAVASQKCSKRDLGCLLDQQQEPQGLDVEHQIAGGDVNVLESEANLFKEVDEKVAAEGSKLLEEGAKVMKAVI